MYMYVCLPLSAFMRKTDKRGGREEEESEVWKGLQAVECKRCSFLRLPILLHLERVHSHLCVAAASSREGGDGRSRHEQRHVRQRPRLHRGQKGTLYSTVMTVQGCSPGPQLPRTPIVAQCAASLASPRLREKRKAWYNAYT